MNPFESFLEAEILSYFIAQGAKSIDPKDVAKALRRVGSQNVAIEMKIDEVVEHYRKLAA